MAGDSGAVGREAPAVRLGGLQPVGERPPLVPVSDEEQRDASDLNESQQLHGSADPPTADERCVADGALVRLLSKDGFAGPRFERFQDEIARYGIAVMRGWLYSGFIFQLASSRGFKIHPGAEELDELAKDSDLREELALETVARALPRFRQHALVDGNWTPTGGARITTYFMGACAYVFPNVYRQHMAHEARWKRAVSPTALEDAPEPAVQNVAEEVLSNLRVLEDLRDLENNPRLQAVVALTIDGHSQEEIRQMVGEESVRAIEALLYRWRTQERQKEEGVDE